MVQPREEAALWFLCWARSDRLQSVPAWGQGGGGGRGVGTYRVKEPPCRMLPKPRHLVRPCTALHALLLLTAFAAPCVAPVPSLLHQQSLASSSIQPWRPPSTPTRGAGGWVSTVKTSPDSVVTAYITTRRVVRPHPASNGTHCIATLGSTVLSAVTPGTQHIASVSHQGSTGQAGHPPATPRQRRNGTSQTACARRCPCAGRVRTHTRRCLRHCCYLMLHHAVLCCVVLCPPLPPHPPHPSGRW